MEETIKKCEQEIENLKAQIEIEQDTETKKELKADLQELRIILATLL